jgi:adenine phosphoribosyltransferase
MTSLSTYTETMFHSDIRLLFDCLNGCELVEIPDTKYKFCFNSLTEQTPPISSEMLAAFARLIYWIGLENKIFSSNNDDNFLLSEEDRGAVLATAVLMQVRGKLALARWMLPVSKSEIPRITLKMEYTEQDLYLMGLKKDEPSQELIIIDDFVSTGGTLISLIQAVKEQTNHTIKGVITVADKGYGGIEKVKAQTGVEVVTLAKLDLDGERLGIKEFMVPNGPEILEQLKARCE